MRRFLFIYREDREAFCDPEFGYEDRTKVVEKAFPAGTPDSEVMEAARAGEVRDLIEDRNTASEGRLNRVLQRVVEVAREIDLA